MERRRLWTTRVPGVIGGRVHVDAESASVFVGDGWGVAYAALAVRRLDLVDGAESARVRTRSRAASAFAVVADRLVICTDRRIIVADTRTLEPVEEYAFSGVRWASRIAATEHLVVVTNPRLPSICVIDRATGTSARRAVAAEPSVIARGDVIDVYSAVDTRMRTVTTASAAPMKVARPTALLNPTAGRRGVQWAQVAGRSDGTTGETLSSGTCVDLTTGDTITIPADLRLVAVGDTALWTIDAGRSRRHLQVWSQRDGQLMGESRWDVSDGDVRVLEVEIADPAGGVTSGTSLSAVVITGASVGEDATDLTAWHITG